MDGWLLPQAKTTKPCEKSKENIESKESSNSESTDDEEKTAKSTQEKENDKIQDAEF